MSKTVNIELSETKYQQLARLAKQSHISVNCIIEKCLDSLLPGEQPSSADYKNDPLYKMKGSFNSGLGDLSLNHDKYLYG